ncbi:unnamed protein product, partial [Ectocarpus fasciculatus]
GRRCLRCGGSGASWGRRSSRAARCLRWAGARGRTGTTQLSRRWRCCAPVSGSQGIRGWPDRACAKLAAAWA